jgi:radical SAM-linked protein
MSDRPAPVQRLRITFAKQGALKFIGHLDLAKTWERILRRAQLALAYTQGFNAHPRLQLASPLPLGFTST